VSNFIFNAAAAALVAATLDLSTGNYYAHLVTAAPALTDSTVANLVLSTASGYAPTALTGLSDNSQRWTFDSFTFPRYIFAVTPPVGVVICKRAGASPVSSDQIICYSDFLNSIGQVIATPVGAYAMVLTFGTSGAINKLYRYQYNSGAYVAGANGGIPFGLIYLLGTANNTTTFTNPSPLKLPSLGIGGTAQALITDRNSGGTANSTDTAWDFGNKAVRVGDFGYLHQSAVSTPVTIYGSNNLPGGLTAADITNNANWTQIATVSAVVNTTAGWHLATSSSSTYWRYLRFSSGSSTIGLNEIELYNSSIISPTQNLV
jgi:hypothetical protein